jgi:Fe-Mn family superoxide dismutase
MRLHELYFGNIAKSARPLGDGALKRLIIADFGSFDSFENEIRAVCAMRGIGWALLYYDSVSARLFCCWIDEHDKGHPAGCIPLLVLDLFEHAYLHDYGTKRQDYVDAVWKVIDWKSVENRLNCR